MYVISNDEDTGILELIYREGSLFGCKLPNQIEHLPPLNFGSESEIGDYELTECYRYPASSVILRNYAK